MTNLINFNGQPPEPKNFLEWLRSEFPELKFGWDEIESAYAYYHKEKTSEIKKRDGYHCHCALTEAHTHPASEWWSNEVCICYDSKK